MSDKKSDANRLSYIASFAGRGTEHVTGAVTTPFQSFIIGDTGATISVLTPDANHDGVALTSFPWTAGKWYPISGTAMTVTAGSVLLIKK